MLDITQEELAMTVGISRSYVAGIEAGKVNPSLDVVTRIGDALGLDLELMGRRPILLDPRSTGVVHSRCSGYASRRLRSSGWLVAREVEIVHARSHGWIDLLAFHPGTRTLVIVEIKTRIEDIGLIERQLAWYERSAPVVAADRFGWRPSSVASWPLLLQSDEVESAVLRDREVLHQVFPVRATDMRAVLAGALPSTGLIAVWR
jgi:transcriptional regulator with XRE-family HTH domain